MENTGIRDFCREYCKGNCCCTVRKECGESCKSGKLPITCSLFICPAMAGVLGLGKYYDLSEKIICKQAENERWKPKRIKIGEDELKLLKLLERLNWDKVSVRLAYLKDIIEWVKLK